MDGEELELPTDVRPDDQPASIATAPQETLALSHSQVEMYMQCPRRWWLLKRAGVRRAPSESLILGLAVHAAIEADLRRRLADEGAQPTTESERQPTTESERPSDVPTRSSSVSASSASSAVNLSATSSSPDVVARPASPLPAPDGADPLAAAFAALYEEEDPTGLIALQRRELLLAQGRAALRAYEGIAPRMRPVEIERDFAFTHPDDASITFTGRMDAVTQPDHGSQERTIVDWKVPRRAWAWGEENRRIQAAAYLWAEEQMGWERSARFTFVTFPPASPAEAPAGDEAGPRTVDARPTYRSASQLAAYARLVRETATSIRASESWGEEGFPARPSALCPWCEVRGACPTGRRYVHQRGLTPRVPELRPEESGA